SRNACNASPRCRSGSTLEPRLRTTRAMSLRFQTALDDDAYRFRTGDGAGLGQFQAYPWHAELVVDDRGATLGQRFHQFETGRFDESDQALGHRLVVYGVLDLVAGGGFAVVESHFNVEHDFLAHVAFPVVDADDGFDFQRFDENDIHGSGDLGQRFQVPARQHAD